MISEARAGPRAGEASPDSARCVRVRSSCRPTRRRGIGNLVARGSERGYVTYDELSATLPLDQLSSEQIEDTLTML